MAGQKTSSSSQMDVDRLALSRCRSAFIAVGVASALINVLYLTGSFYMLQVYDRVLPSRSLPTLVALSLLAILLYAFQGLFDAVRSRILVRIASVFDEIMSARIFRATLKAPVRLRAEGDSMQMIRDFDQVRGFLTGPGPGAFFDLPWMPVYIAICFLFHPIIGMIAVGGAIILVITTLLNNRSTQAYAREAHELSIKRSGFASAAQRNAEIVQAMGMSGALEAIWQRHNAEYRASNTANADVANGFGAFAKVFRALLQSATLAAGAILVIENQATGGIIIAASILTARALAPVDQAIANWRSFVAASQGWKRLRQALKALPAEEPPMPLPAPTRDLRVESLVSGPAGSRDILVTNVSFSVNAGSAVGVIGPSGSGKSSMVRALTGVWPLHRGSIRLDGAALEQWDEATIGRHIGYLPQDVELFSGTIAQNIARFDPEEDPVAVIRAAQMAGVHDLILRMPKGYDTIIGAGGSTLSAGQRQRVALARALYRDPFLIVLDEPNSNLDGEGEAALTRAIMAVRSRGGIVIIVAHRPSALEATDLVLVMNDGKMGAFGPKEEVLHKVLRQDIRVAGGERAAPLKVVSSEVQE